jgi:hypothetical protein
MSRAGASVLAAVIVMALSTEGGAEPLRVQILSAVVKDQKIAGATVILQKNGAPSATAATDTEGEARLAPSFSEKEEGVLILVKKAGYSTLVARCPCEGMTYAISPIMTSLDGLRVVLNWGPAPADLDSHIVFPGNHVFWERKRGEQVGLDVDDVTSFGPETITIEKKRFGQKYVYAVHDYTHLKELDSNALSMSRAKVFVYIGQSLIRSYYVPLNRAGTLWVVFAIDGQGEIHDINSIERGPWNGGQLDVAALNRHLGEGAAYAARADTTEAATGEARRLNALGEAAYRGGDLEEAIARYGQAIELDPGYGQAYSNLGLAYQKTGRVAEAIWANRKAIALASGAAAHVTRASSYFNVARIYEEAGQFDDALGQYELANLEKPSGVYATAIGRMKAKLGK